MDLQKKKLSTEINRAVNQGFQINTQSDEDYLVDKNYNWDDLNKLKDDLGVSILQFVGQVNSVITNGDIINNLGDRKTHFEKVVNVFFTDINAFSMKVKVLREQHENNSGHVNNLNEFNTYNRIAISYHSLFTELTTLVTPTLSELMLVISEIVKPTTEQ